MYCGTARTATLGRLFRSAPYYLRAGVNLSLGPTLTLIRPTSGSRHTRTSENAVKQKFNIREPDTGEARTDGSAGKARNWSDRGNCTGGYSSSTNSSRGTPYALAIFVTVGM